AQRAGLPRPASPPAGAAPAQRAGVHRDAAHNLDAARHDDVLGAAAMTAWAAKCAACWLEPHWRSTEVAGMLSGQPAASTALRPMLRACSEAWTTRPAMTSSM